MTTDHVVNPHGCVPHHVAVVRKRDESVPFVVHIRVTVINTAALPYFCID